MAEGAERLPIRGRLRIMVALGRADSTDAAGPAPPAANDAGATLSCAEFMAGRLLRIDQTLAAWSADLRPSSFTARRILTVDRNAQAAACRACGACDLSAAGLTDPLPLP